MTARLALRGPELADAGQMLDYYQRNRLHFRQWEPSRDEGFYSPDRMRTRILSMQQNMATGQALHLVLREPDATAIVGECAFTNIVRGPFQACHLGFSLCQGFQGRGLMREGLQAAIAYVFDELGLHRVMANYRPENERSQRLLQSLGFEREGLARAYLHIDGEWRDHVLTSLIRPDGKYV